MDASDTENTNDLIIKIKKEEVEEWYYKDKNTGTVGVRKYEKGNCLLTTFEFYICSHVFNSS
jgi:hypothetical protein